MNQEMVTKVDVLKKLGRLDTRIGELELAEKPKIIIFGGAAFLLRLDQFRPTQDIDIYLENARREDKLLSILSDLNINISGHAVELPPIEEFRDRLVTLDINFQHIEVEVFSFLDLIISKVFSTRGDKDMIDLIRCNILDLVSENKIRELYEYYKEDIILNPSRYNTLDDIIEQRKIYKMKRGELNEDV